ncbi:MAG: SDR family oxidoreductase, partial [Alphaproteobacteria bacterium]|nr:SDR family oxidoreductase [Alphaproteobacteria bacterium]
KTVLITGTSSGLGAGLAVAAAQQGYKVYATMRDLGKRGALEKIAHDAKVEVKLLQLDVQNDASVAAAMAALAAQDGAPDIVINNAGAGFARATEQTSMQEIAQVIDLNFMGVVRVTKAALPLMRKKGGGRFINISSVGGLVGQPFNEIYCAAKFAVEGFTESLASYVQDEFGILFTLVEPGGIKSEFFNTAMKQIMGSGGLLQDDYLPLLQRYMAGAQKRGQSSFQTPEQVVDVVMKVMAMENPPLRIRTSDWADDFTRLKTSADPDGTQLRKQVTQIFLGQG